MRAVLLYKPVSQGEHNHVFMDISLAQPHNQYTDAVPYSIICDSVRVEFFKLVSLFKYLVLNNPLLSNVTIK